MEIKDIISSGLLEAYVMGLTTATENQQVLQWIEQYPELADELLAIQSGMEIYASAHAIQPSDKVKEKLFDKLNLNSDTPNTAKVVPFNYNRWKWIAAAAILILAGSMALNLFFYTQNKDARHELATTLDKLEATSKQYKQMENDGQIISNPLSVPVALKGLETMPAAVAKIFWIQNTGDVFIDATQLPAAPAGSQYQFWAIVNGVPVNGGLILNTSSGVFHLQRMKAFGKAEAFAISLEPSGGSVKPTRVVSLGKPI